MSGVHPNFSAILRAPGSDVLKTPFYQYNEGMEMPVKTPTDAKFCHFVRAKRKELGITQAELAERAGMNRVQLPVASSVHCWAKFRPTVPNAVRGVFKRPRSNETS